MAVLCGSAHNAVFGISDRNSPLTVHKLFTSATTLKMWTSEADELAGPSTYKYKYKYKYFLHSTMPSVTSRTCTVS